MTSFFLPYKQVADFAPQSSALCCQSTSVTLGVAVTLFRSSSAGILFHFCVSCSCTFREINVIVFFFDTVSESTLDSTWADSKILATVNALSSVSPSSCNSLSLNRLCAHFSMS